MTAAITDRLRKIRPLRLCAALLVAAILSSLLLLAIEAIKPDVNSQSFSIMAFSLATSFVIWLPGTAAVAASRARRGGGHRGDFLLAGSALAFLLPLAGALVSVYVAPWLLPDLHAFGERDVPIGASIAAGLLNIPFGWFGGRVVWRFGFQPETQLDLDEGRVTRFSESLGIWRVLVSLCALPLLPAAITAGALALYVLDMYSAPWLAEIWWHLVSWVTLAALALSIVIGLTYVYGLSRGNNRVSRSGCLALGGTVALLLPLVCAAIAFPLGEILPSVRVLALQVKFESPMFQIVAVFYLFGTILLPFGLPGGWLFWRLGVAPAPEPLPIADPAAVFD